MNQKRAKTFSLHQLWVLFTVVLLFSSCGGGSGDNPATPASTSTEASTTDTSTSTSTTTTTTTTSTSTTDTTTTPASTFQVSMPIQASDAASNMYGINPFGIHIGDHGVDGHPGWDVEYTPGASVLAAADGIITVNTDAYDNTKSTLQISHTFGGKSYRTIYTNIATVASGISTGVQVTEGQPIGVAGTVNGTVGTTNVTFAMTHFQLDDFSITTDALSNVNAVSPENYLNAGGKALFDTLWKTAAYNKEIVEPYPGNPRNVTYPLTRTWTLQSGSHAAKIDFTLASAAANSFQYTFYDATGTATENGTVTLNPLANPTTIDLTSGTTRSGVYDIISGTMQIDYGAPGGARPSSFANASIYVTN